MRWMLLGLSAAGLVAAQSDREVSPAGRIEGTVAHWVTGAPIPRVQLTAIRTDPRSENESRTIHSGTSDSEGRFVLDDLEPGTYVLHGWRNGYLRMQYGATRPNRPGRPLTVVANKSMRIEFRLAPPSVITVRVFDEFGEAVSGVSFT